MSGFVSLFFYMFDCIRGVSRRLLHLSLEFVVPGASTYEVCWIPLDEVVIDTVGVLTLLYREGDVLVGHRFILSRATFRCMSHRLQRVCVRMLAVCTMEVISLGILIYAFLCRPRLRPAIIGDPIDCEYDN